MPHSTTHTYVYFCVQVRVVLEQNRYKVRYSATETIAGSAVWVTAKNLAYAEKPCWRLEEGVRVVGQYRDDTNQTFDGWYAGTVGEKPASYNGHRYLIFFDDGGVQYLKSEDLRLIYAQKENPRETYLDIPEAFEPLKLFMEGYLQRYPERMMVRVRRPREKIKAERLGRWYVNKGEQATVVEIDASLIKVRFPTNPPVEEWLFRGSPRLWEVSDKQKDTKRHRVSRQPTQRRRVEMVNDSVVHLQKARKSTVPRTQRSGYREFFDNDWSSESSDSDSSEREEEDIFKEQQFGYLSRRGLADFRILEETLPPNRRKPADIRNHGFGSCSRRCIPARRDEEAAMLQVKGKSPFMAPLLCGWNRQLAELDDRKKKMVYYIAPCGRRLRGVSEMIKYLKVTGSTLPGDYFTFDRSVQPLRMYKVVGALFEMEDYSKGNENVPISVVNTFTTEPPPDISYSADRYPWEGVTIPKICSGCNCEDDCSDPKKCSCQKLTMEEVMCLVPDDRPPVHRRTYQTERRLAHYGKTGIKSGIFECNDTCRCRVSRCVNRVAQRPLMIPLQLFKTAEKGWGIRTLIDVPKGQFICIYAGAILSDEVAETLGGEMEGADEYFADLDLIAAVEREKEGYESGEETDEGEEEEEVIPHEK